MPFIARECERENGPILVPYKADQRQDKAVEGQAGSIDEGKAQRYQVLGGFKDDLGRKFGFPKYQKNIRILQGL